MSRDDTPFRPLELLIAGRLLVAPPEGLSDRALAAKISPYDGGDSPLPDRIVKSCAALQARGLLECGVRNRLTPHARPQILDALGLKALAGKPRFEALINHSFSARALGLQPPEAPKDRQQFAGADGLRATLVIQALATTGAAPSFPTATFAKRALAARILCARLDLEATDINRPPRIQGAALAMALSSGLGSRSLLDPDLAFKRFAGRAVGEDQPLSPRSLRRHLLKAWSANTNPIHPYTMSASVVAPGGDSEVADGNFLDRLSSILGAAPHGRFGDDRLFIAAAFDAFQAEAGEGSIDRAAFDRELLAASRRGELTLTRADYVEAMDPDLVRRSLVIDRGSERHFITIPVEARRP